MSVFSSIVDILLQMKTRQEEACFCVSYRWKFDASGTTPVFVLAIWENPWDQKT